MAIGTSQGAFYEDQFHYSQSQWDPKYDDNEITPNKQRTDKALEGAEVDPSTGLGIDVAFKNASPYAFDYRNKSYNNNYDTKLTHDEEKTYNSRFGPDDSIDYDMRGYFKANPDVKPNDPGVHYPDTFKKPNHPTFSDQSKYNGVDGYYGGVWGKEDDKDTFNPSSTNLNNMNKDQLQDYFNRVEPKAILKLPKPDIEDRRDDPPYKPTLDNKIDEILGQQGSYDPANSKFLEGRNYTDLEKQAGMKSLDKLDLDQLMGYIKRGQNLSAKD